MPVRSDITGQRFGKLTAIRTNGQDKPGGKFMWLCMCDCGKERTVKVDNLKGGHTRSCGCLVSHSKRTSDENLLVRRAGVQRWRESHKADLKAYGRKRSKSNHGLTVEQYEELLAKQGRVCILCKVPSQFNLQIDHDHRCCNKTYSCGRCVRGLLCITCNRALGMFKDSPELLMRAARYLEAFGAVETSAWGAGRKPVKIQSDLHGDVQRAAEMTAPLFEN